jgi:hypothetical protein
VRETVDAGVRAQEQSRASQSPTASFIPDGSSRDVATGFSPGAATASVSKGQKQYLSLEDAKARESQWHPDRGGLTAEQVARSKPSPKAQDGLAEKPPKGPQSAKDLAGKMLAQEGWTGPPPAASGKGRPDAASLASPTDVEAAARKEYRGLASKGKPSPAPAARSWADRRKAQADASATDGAGTLKFTPNEGGKPWTRKTGLTPRPKTERAVASKKTDTTPTAAGDTKTPGSEPVAKPETQGPTGIAAAMAKIKAHKGKGSVDLSGIEGLSRRQAYQAMRRGGSWGQEFSGEFGGKKGRWATGGDRMARTGIYAKPDSKKPSASPEKALAKAPEPAPEPAKPQASAPKPAPTKPRHLGHEAIAAKRKAWEGSELRRVREERAKAPPAASPAGGAKADYAQLKGIMDGATKPTSASPPPGGGAPPAVDRFAAARAHVRAGKSSPGETASRRRPPVKPAAPPMKPGAPPAAAQAVAALQGAGGGAPAGPKPPRGMVPPAQMAAAMKRRSAAAGPRPGSQSGLPMPKATTAPGKAITAKVPSAAPVAPTKVGT